MPNLRVLTIAACVALAGGCATTPEPPKDARGRRVPAPDMQKAVFDLIQVSLICLQYNQPNQPGKLFLKGVFSESGTPAKVIDEQSTPGNERAVGCIGEQVNRVKSPFSGPQVVFYAIPIPVRAEDIKVYFGPTKPEGK
jgi:hypothetical protein